jgi:hypothetical protein
MGGKGPLMELTLASWLNWRINAQVRLAHAQK